MDWLTIRQPRVIEWGTMPRQRDLDRNIASTIAGPRSVKSSIQPPAITVIGEVVRLRERGLQWFDLLPTDLVVSSLTANEIA